MRFATYSVDGQVLYGAVTEEGMIALSPDRPEWPSLREVIEAGALTELKNAAQGCTVTHPEGSFSYETPVPSPEKFVNGVADEP